MKFKLLIFGILISVTSYSQIQTGTYELLSDTTKVLGSWRYTWLHLNGDKTFRIEHRTSTSCFLWTDIYGSWMMNGNKLVLVDNVSNDKETIKRTTTYLIDNWDLILQEQTTSKLSLLPGNGHFGTFRKRGYNCAQHS